MKKIIVTTALLLAATVASAQNFGGIEYNYRDGYGADKGTEQNGYTLTLGTAVAKNTDVDVKSVFRNTNGSGDVNTRLEVGLTQKYDLGRGFSAYARGAVGERWDQGSNFSYYSVEPGIKYAVTPALGVRVGYRYRDSFQDNKGFQTNTLRLGAEYAVSKNGSIAVGYDRFYKDSEFNGLNVGYNFRF